MQKTSKQGLAILALSILLAISFALTITFASFRVTESATGTVTFTGDVSVAWTDNGSGLTFVGTGDAGCSFTLNETHFQYDAEMTTATLNQTARDALAKIQVTFTNKSALTMAWTVALDNETASQGLVVDLAENLTGDVAAKSGGINGTKELTLAQIIEEITVTMDGFTSTTFKIDATIEPKQVASPVQPQEPEAQAVKYENYNF